MAKKHVSLTPATAALRQAGVNYTEHLVTYVDHGGTRDAALQLGLDEHLIIKTLIMLDDQAKPHVVLMHGDREVSLKNLARQIGTKSMSPAPAGEAPKYSGYQLGGTSPFGTRKQMPVWVEESILAFPSIYINGGQRGYLVMIDPKELVRVLGAKPVNVANPPK